MAAVAGVEGSQPFRNKPPASQPRGRIPGDPAPRASDMASEPNKKANVAADERPVTLADLPGDVLAHVAELTGSKLGDALPRLRATSRALAVKSAESTFSAIDEITRPHAGHARSK